MTGSEMVLFLIRFWPALIPLIVYWLWLKWVGRKATIEGMPVLRFRDGPWYWAVLASLLIGAGCYVALALEMTPHKGTYIPPHMEDGRLVPGVVTP